MNRKEQILKAIAENDAARRASNGRYILRSRELHAALADDALPWNDAPSSSGITAPSPAPAPFISPNLGGPVEGATLLEPLTPHEPPPALERDPDAPAPATVSEATLLDAIPTKPDASREPFELEPVASD